MCVATCETSSRINWNTLRHNVYHRLGCYFSYENKFIMAKGVLGQCRILRRLRLEWTGFRLKFPNAIHERECSNTPRLFTVRNLATVNVTKFNDTKRYETLQQLTQRNSTTLKQRKSTTVEDMKQCNIRLQVTLEVLILFPGSYPWTPKVRHRPNWKSGSFVRRKQFKFPGFS